jgi:hypothetical protein
MKPGAQIVESPVPWSIFATGRPKDQEMKFYHHVRKGDRMAGRVRISDARRKLVAFTYRRQVEKDTGAGLVGAKQRAKRIVACVNGCYGIPNKTLKRPDWLLEFATDLMRMACDFGDLKLQTLPERIARNMQEIYAEWMKQPPLPDEEDDDERLDPEVLC